MSLEATLLLSVGTAVAKAILRTWLKDAQTTSDGGAGTVLDLIRATTTDRLAQLRASRAFERIGEDVAESLLPTFQYSDIVPDEVDREKVAMRVADTLDAFAVDSQFTAGVGQDPRKMADYLVASSPTSAHAVSFDEEALYKRAIFDTSQAIVDVASHLPSYSERTLTEILRREDLLVLASQQLLQERRSLLKFAAPADVTAQLLETDYRRAVIRNVARLEYNVSNSSARQVDLNSVFLPPTLTPGVQPTIDEVGPGRTGADTQKSEMEPLQFLSQSRRWLILGDPGVGKTTFLRWVAGRAAGKQFTGELAAWNQCVPFLVPLREIGPVESSQLGGLIEKYGNISGLAPKSWIQDQLANGRALVLLDGLDEVPETSRSHLALPWIADIATVYPSARLVVTCRPLAVDRPWFEQYGFRFAVIGPMSLTDIQRFIDRWYSAVLVQEGDGSLPDDVRRVAEKLKRLVASDQRVRDLARTPFLCGTLCAVNWLRHGYLAASRVGLYDQVSQLLLTDPDRHLSRDSTDYPRLSYRTQRALLEHLAYWLLRHFRPPTPVRLQDADAILSKGLEDLTDVDPGVTGTAVRRLFVERSGVLRLVYSDLLDFTHEVFLSFFAANAAVDASDVDVLLRNAPEQIWWDVIVFAAGLASERIRVELIRGLLARADKESDEDLQQKMWRLAGACVDEAVSVPPEVRENVQRHLTQLAPLSTGTL